MKSPLAKACDKWIENHPTTLGRTNPNATYLENRLREAFCDGWNAAQLDFYSAADDRPESSVKQKTKG